MIKLRDFLKLNVYDEEVIIIETDVINKPSKLKTRWTTRGTIPDSVQNKNIISFYMQGRFLVLCVRGEK